MAAKEVGGRPNVRSNLADLADIMSLRDDGDAPIRRRALVGLPVVSVGLHVECRRPERPDEETALLLDRDTTVHAKNGGGVRFPGGGLLGRPDPLPTHRFEGIVLTDAWAETGALGVEPARVGRAVDEELYVASPE